MTTAFPSERGPANAMAESSALLAADLARMAGIATRRVRPVVDGASFEDAPLMLGRAGLANTPLYLGADREFVAAGPILVDLYRQPGNAKSGPDETKDVATAEAEDGGVPADPVEQVERLLTLLGERHAAVFWIGSPSMTDRSLFRHLRTLNKVLIPAVKANSDRPNDKGAERSGSAEAEAVLFRHADGNVMMDVLPLLSDEQISRLFGPAEGLTFLAVDHPSSDGNFVYRSQRPTDAPASRPGMMRFSSDQMQRMAEARLARSQTRIADFLQETGGKSVEGRTREELMRAVARYDRSARDLGIDEERAQGRFAWLMMCSDDRFIQQSGVRAYLRSSGGDPNQKLHRLAEAMVEGWQSKVA